MNLYHFLQLLYSILWPLLGFCIFSLFIYDGGTRRFKGKFHTWIRKRYGHYGIFKVWGLFTITALGGAAYFWNDQNSLSAYLYVDIFLGIFCAIDLDDLINGGNNDKWKKRWESVKNKIKWKMELPVPST